MKFSKNEKKKKKKSKKKFLKKKKKKNNQSRSRNLIWVKMTFLDWILMDEKLYQDQGHYYTSSFLSRNSCSRGCKQELTLLFTHRLFLDPYFKLLWKGVKLMFWLFSFIGAIATNVLQCQEISGISDILSKGQKINTLYSPSPPAPPP